MTAAQRGGRLAGSLALVTGSWRGIGAAVCRAYVAEGARVAVNYPPRDTAARAGAGRLVSELESEGGEAVAIEADVGDRRSVQRMVGKLESEAGGIDILVANAAATGRLPFMEIDEREWDRVMRVNVTGTLLCAQAVYPRMKEAGRGKIITVSSVMAALGMAGGLHYVTSKAALIGFTRALAREIGGEGICVNSVMPGSIRTESEEELYPGAAARTARAQRARQSIPRRGVAEDLAGAMVFLASHDSDFVTGQVIVVDGGWVNY